MQRMAGVEHQDFDTTAYDHVLEKQAGTSVCVLARIRDYHRSYQWI